MVRLYSLFDRKVPAHEQLFFASSDGVASRIVIETAAGERNRLRQFGADFDLYRLGSVDQTSGEVFREETPVYISNVKQILDTIIAMEASNVN